VLTTCQPSTVWCSRERLPAAAAQPAQGSSEPVAPRIYFIYFYQNAVYVHKHVAKIIEIYRYLCNINQISNIK
jgi:hypothetical protein